MRSLFQGGKRKGILRTKLQRRFLKTFRRLKTEGLLLDVFDVNCLVALAIPNAFPDNRCCGNGEIALNSEVLEGKEMGFALL